MQSVQKGANTSSEHVDRLPYEQDALGSAENTHAHWFTVLVPSATLTYVQTVARLWDTTERRITAWVKVSRLRVLPGLANDGLSGKLWLQANCCLSNLVGCESNEEYVCVIY